MENFPNLNWLSMSPSCLKYCTCVYRGVCPELIEENGRERPFLLWNCWIVLWYAYEHIYNNRLNSEVRFAYVARKMWFRFLCSVSWRQREWKDTVEDSAQNKHHKLSSLSCLIVWCEPCSLFRIVQFIETCLVRAPLTYITSPFHHMYSTGFLLWALLFLRSNYQVGSLFLFPVHVL